jgi:exo-beta-1,3-glucanase (GH17 family)
MDDRWASGAAGADRGRPGAVSQSSSSSLISRQKQGSRITPSPLPDSLRSAGHPAAPNAAQSTVPANNRLKSELYDSFLNEYYDLYDKKGAVPEDEANMDRYGPPANQPYGGDYGAPQRRGGGSLAPQQSHNNGNYDSHYAPNAPSSYAYDDAQQQQQTYHSPPYRDSPSPDMHPGIAPANNRYNQQYTPQPYHSPPRKPVSYPQQEEPYGPPAGAVVASSSSAFRGAQDQYQSYSQPENMERPGPGYGGYNSSAQDTRGADPDYGNHNPSQSPYYNNNAQSSHASYSSADHLTTAAAAPATSESLHPYSNSSHGGGYGGGYDSPSRVPLNHPYQNPYDSHSISRNNLNGMDYVDPNALVDDGDDGLFYQTPKRRSMISLNRRSNGSSTALAAGAGAAGLAGAGAAAAAGRAGAHSRNMYTPDPLVHDPLEKETPAAFHSIGADDGEKSRKWKKWLFLVIGILILAGIAAGLVVGLMNRNKSNSSSGGSNAPSSAGVDGPDMNINSPSVKALLNNKNLHKVFMGMAYTPMNTQYPGCLSLKPIQNNVTLDMAVLSQVTNTLRTYGTDCGQNEMILHAISQLQLPDMKVWVGVWLDNNATTNTRQIQQLYNILDGNNTKYIKGVIIGNEVLYRQDLTLTQLEAFITDVRNNLTSRGIDLPVASADLGSNWSASLASAVDVVMSNVHPFFGGVPVEQAAAWTWSFWQSNDVVITKGTNKTQIISEVGWPSQGGNDCAPATTCPDPTSGAVSGISEMNTFMDTFVCQTIANGTDYFW